MTPELTVLALLLIGLAFMALEAFVVGFGLLGILGAAAFFWALSILRHLDTFMGMTVDMPLMVSLGITGAVVLAGCFYCVHLAIKTRKASGAEIMIGMRATVISWNNGHGQVRVDGEEWAANGPQSLAAGDAVTVTARDKLLLTVTKDD
ncbi:MAG: hypothetical protein KGQ41_02125 [Alphaproteobacteria bacterium]|nr:hypothetical protein [Alphaproteobacteria bacterium]